MLHLLGHRSKESRKEIRPKSPPNMETAAQNSQRPLGWPLGGDGGLVRSLVPVGTGCAPVAQVLGAPISHLSSAALSLRGRVKVAHGQPSEAVETLSQTGCGFKSQLA